MRLISGQCRETRPSEGFSPQSAKTRPIIARAAVCMVTTLSQGQKEIAGRAEELLDLET